MLTHAHYLYATIKATCYSITSDSSCHVVKVSAMSVSAYKNDSGPPCFIFARTVRNRQIVSNSATWRADALDQLGPGRLILTKAHQSPHIASSVLPTTGVIALHFSQT